MLYLMTKNLYVILYGIIPLQPTRQRGGIYKLDNHLVEIYRFFSFCFSFFSIWLFFHWGISLVVKRTLE